MFGYILVMQYANNGTLKNYLCINKDTLELSNKISICISIIEGLKFLHDNDIVHRNLHLNNVLIHNEKALLADFGLSKSLLESAKTSEVRGVQSYVDPILLSGRLNYTNKYSKSSDIYSFGVLMWETYTCRSPFEDKSNGDLSYKLYFGLRENREKGMPIQYIDIYEKCWSPDPSLRPKTSEILDSLKNLSEEPIYTDTDILDIDILSTETSYPTVVQQYDLTGEMQRLKGKEYSLKNSKMLSIEEQVNSFESTTSLSDPINLIDSKVNIGKYRSILSNYALKEFDDSSEDQKLVKAWRLNHGLYLAGNNFIPSNRIIFGYNGN
ncbi:kinase-like domain-containing protein [Gigaspora rosea]|uniref:Kinase-like domain-containing protein n=1 Tax=Gigaspora rosea TaxID=44941 RepID=A0A397VX27_9GLOM|nr:kinase-like domain-containing protein [Gigaspora rosea]